MQHHDDGVPKPVAACWYEVPLLNTPSFILNSLCLSWCHRMHHETIMAHWGPFFILGHASRCDSFCSAYSKESFQRTSVSPSHLGDDCLSSSSPSSPFDSSKSCKLLESSGAMESQTWGHIITNESEASWCIIIFFCFFLMLCTFKGNWCKCFFLFFFHFTV